MADFSEIIQEINTNLPDNNTQSITAAKLRDTLIDLTNTIDDQQDSFEESAMSDIQAAIDIVENGVKFETQQLITDTKIVNNIIDGGVNDVLSAEMGKQISDNLSTFSKITDYTTINPEAGGVYTYLNNRAIGDVIEQTSSSVSSNWCLLKYSIDSNKTYYGTLTPRIEMNLNNTYVYYWGDENGLLIKKEKTTSSDYSLNTWTNYELVPPQGAVTLYVMARKAFVSRYSVSYVQFINVAEIQNNLSNLDENKVDKSELTIRKPLFPIQKLFRYINPSTINTEGINIEENISSSTNYVTLKYEIKPITKYILAGKSSSSNLTNVYVYYWADSSGNYISRNMAIQGANFEWGISEEYGLISPENSKYLYVLVPRTLNSTSTVVNNIWNYTVYEESSLDSQEEYDNYFKDKKELTFLSIGNSYSEDMFGYVPYLMKNIAPEVKLTGLMLMQSANTSANPPEGIAESHYRNFVENNAVYFYSRWYSDRVAWRQSSGSNSGYNISIKSALIGRTITIEGNEEVEGSYIDPQNRPKIDIIFLQAAASSARASFKFTTGLMKKITDWLGYPVQFALFSTPYRASNGNNGNAYSYEYIMSNALANLEYAKRWIKSTQSSFLISGCAAIQNARTIEALKLTGAYMEQTNNTSGYGYLSSIDGNHISDGIGRQTNAYTVVGTLLKNMGMDWKGIMGDKTVMTGAQVKWINCPHAHPSTVGTNGNPNVYGTDASTVALAQYCAAMAIEHPTSVYDLSNYNTEIDLTDTDNLNVETMEFNKYIRVLFTLGNGAVAETYSSNGNYTLEGNYTNDISIVPTYFNGSSFVQGNSFKDSLIVIGDNKIAVTKESSELTTVNETISGVSVPVQHYLIDINNAYDIVRITVETQPDYLILVSSNNNEFGTTSGGGHFISGDTCTIEATANEGYHFVNWTVGDTEVSTNSTYTFTISNNGQYVANFEED